MSRSDWRQRMVRRGVDIRSHELPAQATFAGLGKVRERRLKALLIDDDPIFAAVMARYAQRYGIDLRSAGTFSELVDSLDDFQPQVILVDLHLGEDSGLKVADVLEDRPVVLISGNLAPIQDRGDMPSSVVSIVHKKFGAPTILNSAMDSYIQWEPPVRRMRPRS